MSNATDIAEFMTASGHPCRTVPTADIPDWERKLRAKLVLSEAMEFVEAMGCAVETTQGHSVINPVVYSHPNGTVDLVEAADACADLRYVVIGSENTLGIPGEDVFTEVHRSNMTKLWDDPDGNGRKMCRKDADGKVMKPPHYEPPDIHNVLQDAGWLDAKGLLDS